MIHSSSTSSQPSSVLAIMGSVRAGRRCPEITRWVLSLAAAHPTLACEAVDLLDWSLPMTDEPDLPARGGYVHEHTQAWSGKITAARGFLFVTPQYNWGYPAALKNAIDHLHGEWAGKPLIIVSYGGHGGDKCAAQLRVVAAGLGMHVMAASPALTLSRDIILGAPFDPDRDLSGHAASVQRALGELARTLSFKAA